MADAHVSSDWTPAMGKGRWSKRAGRAMVEAWRRSGESRAAFARRHGLGAHRVKYWLDRIEGQGNGAQPSARRQSAEVTFAPVRVVDADPAQVSAPVALEVVIGAAVVRVPPGFDEQHLRRVVSAIGGIAC